jgi:hypothetical protein
MGKWRSDSSRLLDLRTESYTELSSRSANRIENLAAFKCCQPELDLGMLNVRLR